MKKFIKIFAILLLLTYPAFGCFNNDSNPPDNPSDPNPPDNPSDPNPPDSPRATNIILFIGDGMGTEHRKAARWFSVGKDGMLAMDDMASSGSIETFSNNSSVTDSAAAATAMATGIKTDNGLISMDPDGNIVATMLEDAQDQGKLVGLVTTTQMAHATPAAFASHVESRSLMKEIASQMLFTDVDVLLGGGENYFLPSSHQGCFPEYGDTKDNRHLINEAISAGYAYVCNEFSFDDIDPVSTPKLIGLFADEGMSRPYSPSLARMTSKAIDILSNHSSSNGFFLMVEGGQIDWASHANDAGNTIADTLAFDDAVEVAKRFASKTGNTLIIVTGDHETGGMVVSASSSGASNEDGPFYTPDGEPFYVNWSTTGHTGRDVPVTSQGPCSDRLVGLNDNTFVYDVVRCAI